TDSFSILAGDLDLELGVTRSRRPREQVLEAGSLVVEPAAGSLRVRTRDGARSFALEQLLDLCLTNEAMARWKPFAPAPHCPRVSIDGLVVHRRSWRFEASQLELTRIGDPIERMIAARRWARTHGLPRFLFYRVLHETKPCYLDLDSPHYVELLAHLACEAPELAVSEMLPAIDQAWLPDGQGARYACEWRFVAVDPEPWRDQP
ncbi:MAG TPA: lantibiotic dehydratase, partial [Kofleriaceae bacterium]|nr:lantibiotic dehydratase [Kofleriaceae bacterium]